MLRGYENTTNLENVFFFIFQKKRKPTRILKIYKILLSIQQMHFDLKLRNVTVIYNFQNLNSE